ncbi:CLUMA_CG007649, isoform C [Clunio marinus]|uniref:Transporter n=1 Tax=Clunio marinus TaxID=568069 RepID=A0A1J1I5D3_9DIPT|nr:CLUMA_CG007649, isoform C [Clunio marinus]
MQMQEKYTKKVEVPSISSSIATINTTTASTVQLVERGNWGNAIEFVLACVNFALGLGNVWRFPYLCYRNGGGAFLVPYLAMVLVIGLPLFYAELVIGQYSGLGPIKAFSFISPLFKGLGYCVLFTTTFVSIYYMVIISWVLYYLWSSLFPSLIWGNCDNKWNSQNCYSMLQDIKCRGESFLNASAEIFYQKECKSVESICEAHNLEAFNFTSCFNGTHAIPINKVINRTLAAEEFFYENVLGLGNAKWTENWGWPQPHLVVCMALGWILAFFCLFKGVKSIGKIVYFTATFPYFVLTALLIRALTLEGATDGIGYLLSPEWDLLKKPGVWGDASSQVFFSFGIAWGALIVLASYNKFTNNCHFDAVFVSVINFATAIYNGVVVFAILGFLSNSMNVPIQSVTASGPGLTFITYPEAVLLMPLPQIWAFLFFFMMLILGLGSQFGFVQMITSSIVDHWPHLREHQERVTAGTCLGCFIAALPMTCSGGIYLETLIEWHTASWNIFIIGFAEIVILSWVYGFERTFQNIREMEMKISKATKTYWRSVWMVLTPLTLFAVLVFIFTDLKPTVVGTYEFPWWSDLLGYMFGMITLTPFVFYTTKNLLAIHQGKTTFIELLRPSGRWGPQEVDGKRIDRTKKTIE